MDWIYFELFGLICRFLADEFVWCASFERLESAPEIVGVDEFGEMLFSVAHDLHSGSA